MVTTEKEFFQVKSQIEKSSYVRKNYLVSKGTKGYTKYRILRPFLKLKYSLYQKNNPGMPWLSPDAIKALQLLIKADMIGFEYGSGSSTVFLSKFFKKLYSVEHDEPWYKKVVELLKEKGIDNVDISLFKPNEPFQQPFISSQDQLKLSKEDYPIKDDQFLNYINHIETFEDETLDFVSVDGRARASCALKAIPKIKKGGILMLDNSERARYEEIHSAMSNWPSIYTTTGLTDTIFWRKP